MILSCDHVGITVKDLTQSVRFYEVLGFELLGRWTRSERYLRTLVGYPDVVLDVVEMTIPGSVVRLEILEYGGVDAAGIDPANANPGTAHFCIIVDDIEELCARMADHGAGFVSPVQTSDAGPIKGGKVVYMIDPDGIRVELVEMPKRTNVDGAG